MNRYRNNLTWGIIMVLAGAFLLVVQLVPQIDNWIGDNWAVIIIGIGAVFLVFGIATRTPGLAIPASIIGGIGGLLLWQNATDNWESWSYAWTFIPGFVGIGLILSDLLNGKYRLPSSGPTLIVISLIMFVIFGTFLGGPENVLQYWPVLLILIGARQIYRGFVRNKPGDA